MSIVVLLRHRPGAAPATATRATADALRAAVVAGTEWEELADRAGRSAPSWMVCLHDGEAIERADAVALARFLADEALPGVACALDGPDGPVTRVLPWPLRVAVSAALSGAIPAVPLDVALYHAGEPAPGIASRGWAGLVLPADAPAVHPDAPALTVVVVGACGRLADLTAAAVRAQPCSEPVEVVRAATLTEGMRRATGDAVLVLRAGDVPVSGALERRIALHDVGYRAVGGPVHPEPDCLPARVWAAAAHPLGDARRRSMAGPLAVAGASWACDSAPGGRGPAGWHDQAAGTVVRAPESWTALLRCQLRRGAALAREAEDHGDLARRLRLGRVGALLGDRHWTTPGERPLVPRPALRAALAAERAGAWLERRR